MPSLRRTLSSPVVRSSPYHHPTSSSHASSAMRTSTHGHGPRRSSGSETGQRRVLADIDWWRVQEGQREVRGEDFFDNNQGNMPEPSENDFIAMPEVGTADSDAPHGTVTSDDAPLPTGTSTRMGAAGIALVPLVLYAGMAVGEMSMDFHEVCISHRPLFVIPCVAHNRCVLLPENKG